jgi:hypothetical protein
MDLGILWEIHTLFRLPRNTSLSTLKHVTTNIKEPLKYNLYADIGKQRFYLILGTADYNKNLSN